MERSIYSTLPTQTSIRLVELHPGVYADELRCSLHVVDLNDKPHYSAVSYAWGSAGAEQSIFLDGVRILIRQNLYNALRRLRDTTQSRIIWVDLLSINQDHLAEKSQQVAIMGNIFREATEVRIWLGEHADGSQQLFSPHFAETLLSKPSIQIGARLVRHCRLLPYGVLHALLGYAIIYLAVLGPKRHEASSLDGVHVLLILFSIACLVLSSLPGPTCYELMCLYPQWRALLRRQYWERTWIIQEVCLGRKLVLHCGHNTLEWGQLITPLTGYGQSKQFAASQFFREDIATSARSFPYAYIAFNLLELWHPRRNEVLLLEETNRASRLSRSLHGRYSSQSLPTMDELIRYTSHTVCFDRRDRIYAILSLIKSHQNCIRPDYTRDFLHVVADVVRLQPPPPLGVTVTVNASKHYRRNIEIGLLLTKEEKKQLQTLLQ